MRIKLKQQAACLGVVATALAFPLSEAVAAGRGGAGGPHAGAGGSSRQPGPDGARRGAQRRSGLAGSASWGLERRSGPACALWRPRDL